MFSHTQFGLSFIILTFDDNANDYFARQQVLERLQGVDLPDRRPAGAGAALDPDRRDLPLPRPGKGVSATELRSAPGLGGQPQSQDWSPASPTSSASAASSSSTR